MGTMKALGWLAAAAASALLAGFLQGRLSVFWFYVALPFAFVPVGGHVVAVAWPVRAGQLRDERAGWWARPLLGLLVGVVGFVAAAGYGGNHLVWFGQRVTAEVTATRQVCGQNMPRCVTDPRAAVDGEDLGWARMCGEPTRDTVEVVADPWGWIPPRSPACGSGSGFPWSMRLWLAGLAAIALVQLVGHLRVRRPTLFGSVRGGP
ncbi:hypothetical protein GCM10009557_83980 [Virgisporangium ochraceum]